MSRTPWSKTLHLPKSPFPARPLLPSPYLKRCTDDLYAWQRDTRPTSNTFVLHDGPPYANGSLHIGHALNKILKDIICRFQVGQGKRVHYVPGWDCHGLPIEVKALQVLKAHHDDVGPVKVREAARQLAEITVKEQEEGFRDWAIMGDWENAYRTMDKDFEKRQLLVFREMVDKGLIYRQRKPVYWSPSSRTALAEAELEYDENHKSNAAFISLPLNKLTKALAEKLSTTTTPAGIIGAMIWTTTPWTLPANQAIAVHKGMDYCLITISDRSGQHFLVAKSRVDYLRTIFADQTLNIVVESIQGDDIVGAEYGRPFRAGIEANPIIHADFVSSVSGSGLVHLAPGHGMDDYNVCTALGIPALAPVDDEGKFTKDAFPAQPELLQGKPVQTEGTQAVLDYLLSVSTPPGKEHNSNSPAELLAIHEIRHKYPIDWRTKQPVIVRATEQWFADVGGLKEDALESLVGVNFIPDAGKHRLKAFIQGRSQWCISRQRAWGVPIPALFRADQGSQNDIENPKAVMTKASIDHIMKVIDVRGIDAWWTDPEDDESWTAPGLEGKHIRGKDTMDVWFDSGTSWTLLPKRSDGREQSTEDFVADVYLEGTDQHRGWFQSSLLTYIAYQQAGFTSAGLRAPFKTLITHGFTLDQDGRKMSKSLGNVIAPFQITDGSLLPPVKRKKQKGVPTSSQPEYDAMGPDALRLWVASCDYTRDVVVGQPVLAGINQSLHKFRVTFKWLLGTLTDYDAQTEAYKKSECSHETIDEIALFQLQSVSRQVHNSFSNYEFFKAVSSLTRYINQDLSAFYFETLKDRLYTGSKDERMSAQGVLYHIFTNLLVMLGPITPLLVEEVWELTPKQIQDAAQHPLRRIWTPFSTSRSQVEHASNEKKMEFLTETHSAIKVAQEELRSQGKIGSSLECDVHLFIPAAVRNTEDNLFSKDMQEALANAFVVSRVFVGESLKDEKVDGVERSFGLGSQNTGEGCTVLVTKASGEKCERCWRYLDLTDHGLCGRCDGVVKERFPEMLS